MAMAGNLVCARPPTLPSPLAPSPNSATSNHTLGAAFRRTPHQGIGKHSLESGHRDGAGQFIDSCRSLKAIFNSERGTSTSANEEENDLPPAGCSRIKVELSKPLGIAFEDDKYGNIFVGEVIEGGNAYKSGLINAGDQLIATSAIIYNSEEDYQGVMVRKGMQIIRFNVRGERFETVMAAIGTHPAHVKVALEFQKCEPIIGDSINGPAKR